MRCPTVEKLARKLLYYDEECKIELYSVATFKEQDE